MNDKDTLEIKLLEAKILNLEKQNKRGLIREAMPSIWAITFSIVASFIVIMIGDKVVERALTKLDRIESEIMTKQQELVKLKTKATELNKLCSTLIGKPMLYDLGVEFEIEIEQVENAFKIHATSTSPTVKFKAYEMCMSNFVFPGEIPNTSLCNEIEGHCTSENNISRCTFGPLLILPLSEGIWISAEDKGKIVFRYINMKMQ